MESTTKQDGPTAEQVWVHLQTGRGTVTPTAAHRINGVISLHATVCCGEEVILKGQFVILLVYEI